MPDPDRTNFAQAILHRSLGSLDQIAKEIADHTRIGLRGDDLADAMHQWAANTLRTNREGK